MSVNYSYASKNARAVVYMLMAFIVSACSTVKTGSQSDTESQSDQEDCCWAPIVSGGGAQTDQIVLLTDDSDPDAILRNSNLSKGLNEYVLSASKKAALAISDSRDILKSMIPDNGRRTDGEVADLIPSLNRYSFVLVTTYYEESLSTARYQKIRLKILARLVRTKDKKEVGIWNIENPDYQVVGMQCKEECIDEHLIAQGKHMMDSIYPKLKLAIKGKPEVDNGDALVNAGDDGKKEKNPGQWKNINY